MSIQLMYAGFTKNYSKLSQVTGSTAKELSSQGENQS